MIDALMNGHLQTVLSQSSHFSSRKNTFFISQFDTLFELLNLFIRDWIRSLHLINFGDMFFGMGERLQELSIIGQQYQSGGILIQTAHTLNPPIQQNVIKQVKHTKMMRRLMRTLVALW